jgi:hypothetical protein
LHKDAPISRPIHQTGFIRSHPILGGGFTITTSEFEFAVHTTGEYVERSVQDTYPSRAIQLLAEMTSDVDSFYRQVSLSHADASQYVRAPVLAKVAVQDFVNAFFALYPSAQRVVMMALKGRYGYGRLEQDLKQEKPWIVSVHEALMKRLPGLSAIFAAPP